MGICQSLAAVCISVSWEKKGNSEAILVGRIGLLPPWHCSKGGHGRSRGGSGNIPVAGLPSVWCLYSKQHSAGFKSRMERAEDSLGTNTSFLLTCNNDRWLCLIQRFAYEAIQGNRSGNLMPKSALKIELTFRKILQVTLRALFSPEEKAAGGSNI